MMQLMKIAELSLCLCLVVVVVVVVLHMAEATEVSYCGESCPFILFCPHLSFSLHAG